MNISLQKHRIFPHVDTVISLDTFKDLKQKRHLSWALSSKTQNKTDYPKGRISANASYNGLNPASLSVCVQQRKNELFILYACLATTSPKKLNIPAGAFPIPGQSTQTHVTGIREDEGTAKDYFTMRLTVLGKLYLEETGVSFSFFVIPNECSKS